MILTRKQEEAIKIATHRYRQRERYTTVSGYAGTGKSTTIKFIIAALNVSNEKVAYATFTGKASLVLREMGCPNSCTLHKLLYKTRKTPNGFVHTPKRELDFPYEIIVVDEVSMVPKPMWDLLISHGIHIIASGDPFQLPPIGENNGILDSPHIFLDEIMRQALESEIIRLSLDIRTGKKIAIFDGDDLKIIDKGDLVQGMFTWADQILCGTNVTRHKINNEVRALYGRDPETPMHNDKVIALKNDWNLMNDSGDPMINGTIGNLSNIILGKDEGIFGKSLRVSFTPDYADGDKYRIFEDLSIDYNYLIKGVKNYSDKDMWMMKKSRSVPSLFDFGYAITCWKAQGSQYDKVLLLEENFPYGELEHRKFMYTGMTRASKKLVIVKK